MAVGYMRQQSWKKRRPRKLLVVFAVGAVLALAVGGWFVFMRKEAPPKQQSQQVVQQDDKQAEAKTEEPKPPLVDLQPTVDAWVAKQRATYGIVVYDPANKQVIASHNPDQKFFAASLYKLFIAYLALKDFQTGAQNPDEALTQGYTRKECVDKMIRESYSPCGEAMMADMGQETLRQRVSEMGINNTVFAGITTTPQDCALVLQYIVEGRDLNAESTAFLRDAMRVQPAKYRGGLPKGSPEATWDTKVGWNEQYNYHDVGIMTLPGGRQYVVAILSQDNGSPTPIANFSATLYSALAQ